MFSGRWTSQINPSDGSIFIDRSPKLFGMIFDYLCDGWIDLESLSPLTREMLLIEADYFQIKSLVKLIEPELRFHSQIKGSGKLDKIRRNFSLSVDATNARTQLIYGYVISEMPFSRPSESYVEKKIKVVTGSHILIGLAPKSILDSGKTWINCGWYVWCPVGSLCAQGGIDNKPLYKKPITEGSIVSVRWHSNLDVSYAVNGVDWGIAFRGVTDNDGPLHLVVNLDISIEDPKNVSVDIVGRF